MFQVKNGYIFDNNENTGVKAFYSKYEIAQRYGWSMELCRRRLIEIQHEIYKRENGKYNRYKRIFTPTEIEKILNEFGLP